MSSAEPPITAAATFCATLVDEWRALGLRHAVICPGSRSTPMALALVEADGIEVDVCLDERSAAFVALGIARSTGRPVPVLTTSGTATVNLHPAVVEAHQDAVPLLACTADRPPELHGVGAPQTIDQRDLFGFAVRRFMDASVPEETDPTAWRNLAREAWNAATGRPGNHADAPGPVQLNLPFREPLVGRAGELPPRERNPLRGRVRTDDPERWSEIVGRVTDARVVVVSGPPVHDEVVLASYLTDLGWPVLLDPRVPLPASAGIARFDSLLRHDEFAYAAQPDVVLRLGALPSSKVLTSWLDSIDAYQVGIDPWGRRFDPGGSLDTLVCALPERVLGALWSGVGRSGPEDWRQLWQAADTAAEHELTRELLGNGVSEPAVARTVTEVAVERDLEVVVSSSMPVRDVEWFGVRGKRVHANRGANGIDGVVSTTVGVALGRRRPTVGLLGDLAFLHDTNGLLLLGAHPDLDCALVVVDNDGGGIFHFLPQREVLGPERFEQLFGTPQRLDLVAVAHAHGVRAERTETLAALRDQLVNGWGPRVLVVPTDREANVGDHDRLNAAVAGAITPLLR
jgi:2-succinyl-5-enolpyruvyl-6-hydroxy-3-cyclohexene-1-carboxylate synthase